jgi:hypothetical protein
MKHYVALISTVVPAAGAVFAQATDAPTTIVGAFIFISVSMSALVGFIVKKLLDDAASDRAKFTATLHEIEERNDRRSDAEDRRVQSLITAADDRIEKLRVLFQEEQRETRMLFVEMANNMRTAVHDVKDTAQAAISKQAVKDLRAAKDKPGES